MHDALIILMPDLLQETMKNFKICTTAYTTITADEGDDDVDMATAANQQDMNVQAPISASARPSSTDSANEQNATARDEE